MAIATLTNLRQNLEVTMSQPSSSLPEIRSFPSEILLEGSIVFCLGSGRWFRYGLVECVVAGLPLMNVGQEIEVMVKEVYTC